LCSGKFVGQSNLRVVKRFWFRITVPVVKAPRELLDRALKVPFRVKADTTINNVRNRARKHGAETLNALSHAMCLPLQEIVSGYEFEWKRGSAVVNGTSILGATIDGSAAETIDGTAAALVFLFRGNGESFKYNSCFGFSCAFVRAASRFARLLRTVVKLERVMSVISINMVSVSIRMQHTNKIIVTEAAHSCCAFVCRQNG
jgi:hypothetical protein